MDEICVLTNQTRITFKLYIYFWTTSLL